MILRCWIQKSPWKFWNPKNLGGKWRQSWCWNGVFWRFFAFPTIFLSILVQPNTIYFAPFLGMNVLWGCPDNSRWDLPEFLHWIPIRGGVEVWGGGCSCILMKSSFFTCLNLVRALKTPPLTLFYVSLQPSLPHYGVSTARANILEDLKSASQRSCNYFRLNWKYLLLFISYETRILTRL